MSNKKLPNPNVIYPISGYYKEIYEYLNLKVEDLCNLHNIKLVDENYLKTLQLKK